MPYKKNEAMNQEKRKGRKAIPDHFKKLLTEDQKEGLKVLERFGWELFIVRMPLFQPLVIVLRNGSTDEYGLLQEDGSLDVKSDLEIRQ